MPSILGRTLVFSPALLALACAGLPTTSRTGAVHDILISKQISPRDVTVQPGDEVRWINRRLAPVWLYFSREALDEVSCRRGFSFFWGNEESARIEPNQSVSLCFSKTRIVGYWVQNQPIVQGGDRPGATTIPAAIPGAVLVGERTTP